MKAKNMLITERELRKFIIETSNYPLNYINENWHNIIENILSEAELSDKTDDALKEKAEESGISLSTLKAVYRRGLGAWATGHRQGTPQHAWAMGRVNSFISGKGGARKADDDLWKKSKKKKK